MPRLLAGTTVIRMYKYNYFITLFRHNSDKCKFILIDEMLELSAYEPHLLVNYYGTKKAASVLGWVVKEMESRYRLMTKI